MDGTFNLGQLSKLSWELQSLQNAAKRLKCGNNGESPISDEIFILKESLAL